MHKQEFIPTIKIDPKRCDKEGLCVLAYVGDIFEQKGKKRSPILFTPKPVFPVGSAWQFARPMPQSHSTK
jgi:hypothetical protein